MPSNFSLNKDVIRVVIEVFKMRKTMEVMVEMLGNEPTPTQTLLPMTSVGANLEFALVGDNQIDVIHRPRY